MPQGWAFLTMASKGARYSSRRARARDQVVHGEAVGLGVVGDEVLDGGADAAVLDAAHIAGADRAGQVRVLAVRLEVAAAQRGAVQVDGRARAARGRPCGGPPGRAAGRRGGRGPGPRWRRGRWGGQRDGGVVGGPAHAADADRAVRHDQRAQADLGEARAGTTCPARRAAGPWRPGRACRAPPRRPPRAPRRSRVPRCRRVSASVTSSPPRCESVVDAVHPVPAVTV